MLSMNSLSYSAGRAAEPANTIKGLVFENQGADVHPANFTEVAGSITCDVEAADVSCGGAGNCRAAFGRGNVGKDSMGYAFFSMGSLFPAGGQIMEYDDTGKLVRSSQTDGYMYGLEYMGTDACTYAAVGVGLPSQTPSGSVESNPSIVCIKVPEGDGGKATVTPLADLPAGGKQALP